MLRDRIEHDRKFIDILLQTNAQKTAKDRYQDELRIQMEEKKRQAKAEKDRERQEDERLMRKIEEDNKKLQDELENEKRKEREKHEAVSATFIKYIQSQCASL